MPIFIVSSFEEGIRQHNTINSLHLGIVGEIIIQKEEYRHIHLPLASS